MIREQVERSERQDIESRLIDRVAEAAPGVQPAEVVRLLKDQGFREDRIRAVMWSLIDMRKLTMTPDWLLALPVKNVVSGTAIGHQ